MKKQTITVWIKGRRKRFKTPNKVSGEVFRRTLKLEEDIKRHRPIEELAEECYVLVCEVFGNQFSPVDLRRSVDFREVLPLADKMLDHIIAHMVLEPPEKGKVIPFEKRSAARK